MTKNEQYEKNVEDLADASNELCVAIEILKKTPPNTNMRDFALENTYRRKDAVWSLLTKFGF